MRKNIKLLWRKRNDSLQQFTISYYYNSWNTGKISKMPWMCNLLSKEGWSHRTKIFSGGFGKLNSLWNNEVENFSNFTPKMLRSTIPDTTESDIKSEMELLKKWSFQKLHSARHVIFLIIWKNAITKDTKSMILQMQLWINTLLTINEMRRCTTDEMRMRSMWLLQ